MNAVINLRPEELTDEFFKNLKLLANTAKRIEIKLDSVDALNNLSEAEVDERLKLLAEGATISFGMAEFKQYLHTIAG